MIALVPVRDGRLPAGADAAVRECAGRVLLVGSGTRDAASDLRVDVDDVRTCEAGTFAPAAWAEGLVGLLEAEHAVVLPGSPDGRDLLGRLAGVLSRPAYAWCTQVTDAGVVATRHDGAVSVTTRVDRPFVATLVPRQVQSPLEPPRRSTPVDVGLAERRALDAEVLGVDDVDPGEVDLAEAGRILAGGLGLKGDGAFATLGIVAHELRASVGATRPVADRGIVGHERQIGTTGVAVDPTLYVAFGISGAVQHTAGLGAPRRVVSVNTDPSCPMMAMADLAIVADAAATLDALAHLLSGVER